MSLTMAVVALVGSVAFSQGSQGPATASRSSSEVVGFDVDRAGDVRITREPGVGSLARRLVDLRRRRVVDRGRVVRFAVDVRRVRRSDRFLQIFTVSLVAPGPSVAGVLVASDSITGSPERHGIEHSVVTLPTSTGFVECRHLAVSLRDGARSWWVDVAKRCLPSGSARVSVYAQTTAPADAPVLEQYSSDYLRLGGRLDVGGRIQP